MASRTAIQHLKSHEQPYVTIGELVRVTWCSSRSTASRRSTSRSKREQLEARCCGSWTPASTAYLRYKRQEFEQLAEVGPSRTDAERRQVRQKA